MAVAANRQINIQFVGDGFEASNTFPAAENASSPAKADYATLASGANTITAPTGATACTIIPPAGNTTSITLKGVTGDTGIRIHDTDPTCVAIDDSVTTFCLTAAAQITGVRLIWT